MATAKKTTPAKKAAASAPKVGDRDLELGMTGSDVEAVQRVVGAEPDGSFGPATERAVKLYQRDHARLMTGRVAGSIWWPILRDLEG